jgi:hypothetical protein
MKIEPKDSKYAGFSNPLLIDGRQTKCTIRESGEKGIVIFISWRPGNKQEEADKQAIEKWANKKYSFVTSSEGRGENTYFWKSITLLK